MSDHVVHHSSKQGRGRPSKHPPLWGLDEDKIKYVWRSPSQDHGENDGCGKNDFHGWMHRGDGDQGCSLDCELTGVFLFFSREYLTRYIDTFCVGCQKRVPRDKISKPLRVNDHNKDYWNKHSHGVVKHGMIACDSCSNKYYYNLVRSSTIQVIENVVYCMQCPL